MSEREAQSWKPHVVLVDRENRLKPKGHLVQTVSRKEIFR